MHSNVVQLPVPNVLCEKRYGALHSQSGILEQTNIEKKKKIALGKLVLSVGRILVLHHVW